MKHSIQTIKQFVELRADGRSLGHISETLDIPYSTLGDWNIRYRPQIDLRRAIHWERCEANSQLAPDKDLLRLSHIIHKCQNELDQRPIEDFTNSELLRLLSSARRDYFKRRDLILAPLEPRPSVAQPKETSTSLGLPFSPELRQQVDAIGRRLEEQDAQEAALADGISAEPINTALQQSETDPSPEPDKTGQKPDALPNHHNGNHLQEAALSSARPESTLSPARRELINILKRHLQQHGTGEASAKSHNSHTTNGAHDPHGVPALAGEMSADPNELTTKSEAPPVESHNSHSSHNSKVPSELRASDFPAPLPSDSPT